MGVKDAGKVAMDMSDVKYGDINFLQLYDDYIIVVYLQIEDSGSAPRGSCRLRAHRRYLQRPTADPNRRRHDQRRTASTAGGTLHIIEAARQLSGDGGDRQVLNAKQVLSAASAYCRTGKSWLLRRCRPRKRTLNMAEANLRKPLPASTTEAKPFWDAVAQGKLVMQRCGDCRAWVWTRPLCNESAAANGSNGRR